MICAGIDAGSRAIKVVLLDADSLEVVASGTMDQGVEQGARARQLFEAVVKQNGLEAYAVSNQRSHGGQA